MKKTALLGTALAMAFSCGAIAAGEKTLADGVYTAKQAETGQPMFEKSCSTCHNADFYKTTLNGYNGQPLTSMFESIMSGMPADNPGSLMNYEYEAIVAHILSLIGFPAGEEPLSYDSGSMDDITIVRAP